MHVTTNTKKRISRSGVMLMALLVFSSVSALITGALVVWAGTTIKSVRLNRDQEFALQIADSGINYYRWRLAHAPATFGSPATTSPMVFPFLNKDGSVVGRYEITVATPTPGSTVVTVTSKGVYNQSSTTRSVRAKFAIPSLAKFAIVANADMRFGEGTIVYGPLHSNEGIRFDGVAYNTVTSSRTSYDDPDHSGNAEFGVHTHVNVPPSSGITDSFRSAEAPPNTPPLRLDVFVAGREFPVTTVDFPGLTADLSDIKLAAQSGGRYFAQSGYQGYRVVFNTNDTFSLYRVTSVVSPSNRCRNNSQSDEAGWGAWSINNQTLLGTYANPTNGLIFLEDNVWVEGQIDTARITLVAARFPVPGTLPVITVNNNMTYTNYDGRDVLSLIAQGNFNIGLNSANNLRIDGALVSQNGRIGRYHYASQCGANYLRSSITLFGMLATNERYGFSWTDGTGYDDRIISYDSNLLYAPPPSFPLTSDSYQMISWEEL